MLRKYVIFGRGEHTMGGRGYPVRRYPIACKQAARPQGSRRSMFAPIPWSGNSSGASLNRKNTS